MKRILAILLAAAFLCGCCACAENEAVPLNPCGTPACKPADPCKKSCRPACPRPAPKVCKPAPKVCKPAACKPAVEPCRTACAPAPRKTKVMETETYTVYETQIEEDVEVRTRLASRRVPTEEVRDARRVCYTQVSSGGGSPRLARRIQATPKTVTVNTTETYEETYSVPVKRKVRVPVEKTRQVARWVEADAVVAAAPAVEDNASEE